MSRNQTVLPASNRTIKFFLAHFCIVPLFCFSQIANAEMVFSELLPRYEAIEDTRGIWLQKLLKLSLDKTVDEYGPYRFEPIPAMSQARALKSLEENRYPNLFYPLAYESHYSDGSHLTFVPFPLHLGMLGHRVCFYSRNHQEALDKKIKAGELKSLTIGQGPDWTDTRVLRHNGYQIKVAPFYESMFDMVAMRRFDLFCRGVLEIHDEYQRHKETLAIAPGFSFFYKFPVFFYTNKENEKAIARVEKGLRLAHSDGSLVALFKEIYGGQLELTAIWERDIIFLENPLLKDLSVAYEKYFLSPEELEKF